MDKQPIFGIVPDDREFFIAQLERTVVRYEWRCLSYCVMGNHFHLVVETPHSNLGRGMQYLKSGYAQWFNPNKGREGALFERRFWWTIPESEADCFEVVRYVALNPVRSDFVASPEEWPWSSYRACVGLERAPAFLDVATIKDWFGGARSEFRLAQFVGEALPIARLGRDSEGHGWGLTPFGTALLQERRRRGYAACTSQPRYMRASTASVTNAVAWRASANV